MSLLTKVARQIAPQLVLNWQTKHDPFTRSLVIALNQTFYSDSNQDDQLNQYLRSRSPELQSGMTTYLLRQIERTSDANDRRHACRKWVLDEAFEYSPIRALFQSASAYSEDVESGIRHPSAIGLWELAPQIVPLLLTERLKKHNAVGAVLDDMRLEGLWFHTKLHFANIGRISVNDCAHFRGVDWYRSLVNLLVARAELVIRDRLGAPDTTAMTSIDDDLAEILEFLDLSRYYKLSTLATALARGFR